MRHVVVRKLLHAVPVLLIVSFATMYMLDLSPGDPAHAIYGDQATPEQAAAVRAALNLDDPLPVRYVKWLGDMFTGDFGTSFRTHQPVWDAISERLPVTIEIALLSVLMALAAAIPLGMYAAYKADSRADRGIQLLSSIVISSPQFLTAVIIAFALAIKWTVFPVTGWTSLSDNVVLNLKSVFLPALTLAVGEFAVFVRLLRSDMIATLQEDFILSAKSKGLAPRYVLVRHALRPSSFSLLTLAGLALGRTLGGAVIVEYIFALPGLGNLLLQSIQAKDIVMVQGIVLFIALAYVVVNVIVDLAYAAVDPRVRSGRS